MSSYGGVAIETGQIAAKRKSAISGAFFTEFVDMFDIYLPTIILTPALDYFEPSKLPAGLEGILTSLVFITTLLGRPLGAMIFGAIGDKIGRRKTTIYSVSGFALVTLILALIPGYSSIGIASYWLLVILRFLDGVCLGGGYTGSHPLALEYSEKSRRGFVGAFILAAFPLAYILINLLGMVSFSIFPAGSAASPYEVWGWRIPFVIGAILAVWLVTYYVRSVPESEIWETSKQAKKTPLMSMFKGQNGRNFLQVFTMMTGFWLTQNIVTLFLPSTVLKTFLGMKGFPLTLTLLIAYAVLFFSYLASGVIGQRIGRRKFFVIMGPIVSVVGTALLYWILNAKGAPLILMIVLVSVFAAIVTSPWGVIVTYINERFATGVRASGFALGFSVSVIIPSFYAFFMDWLGAAMPYRLTGLVLLFIGGLIGTIGAAAGPETKDVDFTNE
ncbi:MFS transporter [Alicyclobacillus fastidiosus]|uniref:MFS transporter n=1 Tax=Alicyclobacillus fastidiosus TaxID=392011 RepID=UPI0023E91206|nr:MFS transporter [Alicyclobacillus fastidiosus]GMA66148.1 MFS transporter [Alicyclobacillus fastidiosus]